MLIDLSDRDNKAFIALLLAAKLWGTPGLGGRFGTVGAMVCTPRFSS